MRFSAHAFAATVMLAACGEGPTPPGPGAFPTHPAQATFVLDDIERFWAAYDAGGRTGSESAFKTEYLDRASAGLRDFAVSRNVTPRSLVRMVQSRSRYFAAIRANTLRLAQDPALIERMRENFEEIETRYPAAVYPPVTFLIGRFTSGGTVLNGRMLIGTEFFAIDDTTPVSELGNFERANVKPLDSIPLIVAHEHVHVLQALAAPLVGKSGKTLLEASLLEGGADFVGELVSGGHINGHVYAYGLLHESELWTQFSAVMNGTNVSQWLYNQGSAAGPRPGDLGYFIGYRIAQAYYNLAADKTAALKAIISVQNAAAFLSASGYDP